MANHQTAFGGQALSYDLNGNLTSDGVNTYTWNARDQLASISGPGLTASFQYDATGRRISKTINSNTTSYLYNGANAVQEKVGSTVTANMLTGGIDRVLSRADSSGTVTPISDALGSVIALTDASGSVQTEYTYDPFGKSAVTGTANDNPSRYTGREDDATGLYYYRARYYSPTFQRFISEDPIGFRGGDINLFAYVSNNPIMGTDPSGLEQYGYRSNGTAVLPKIGGRSCGSRGDMGGMMAIACCVAVIDTPAPGPADVVALGILGVGAIISASNPPRLIPIDDTDTDSFPAPRKDDSGNETYYHYSDKLFVPGTGLWVGSSATTIPGLDSYTASQTCGIRPPLYQYTVTIDRNKTRVQYMGPTPNSNRYFGGAPDYYFPDGTPPG